MRSLFVTGTDTDVGKTVVSSLLSLAFSKKISTSYFKPIQTGSPLDSVRVEELTSEKIKIKKSTYSFEPPIAPHRAAALKEERIEMNKILSDFLSFTDGLMIVEGAGGLMVPINEQEQMIDLIQQMDIPVILVASTRLGTINHTLLSVQALKNKGLSCLGLVINGEPDPGLCEILTQQTQLPVLFELSPLDLLNTEVLEEEIQNNLNLREFVEYFLKQHEENPIKPDLQAVDQALVWHPFTQHGIIDQHPIIKKGRAASLLYNDQWVIDAISSWWVNLLGHNHPELSRAVARQAHELEHVLFAGFTHEPAILLSQKLIQLTTSRGCHLSKVFFSDNGSTAVEVALKMAYQYFQQKGDMKRTKFLALRGSYHGDTLGAMSVGEREGFNQVFKPLMFDVDFVDPYDLEELEVAFEKFGSQYAACIVEPMIQGASGMRIYSSEFLDRLAELAKKQGVLVICDEVFTGFYRTGKLFAFEHTSLKPDLLCLSKGLTGGYLPLSVTLTQQSLYDEFCNDSMQQAFLHGHSYTANPIACRVALATLEVLMRPETLSQIENVISWTQKALDRLNDNPRIYNVRQLGTIAAMEVFDENPTYFKGNFSNQFNQRAIQSGVLLRPLGGTVYTVPPYCITENEIEKTFATINQLVSEGF